MTNQSRQRRADRGKHRPFARAEALFVVALVLACGANREGGARQVAGSVGGGAGSGSIVNPMGGRGGASGSCDMHCSPDLHEALDCADKVVKRCPDDQGCLAGNCVEACAAAQANGSAQGCEFYAAQPGTDKEDTGGGVCFAALVANTWITPVTIAVDYGGMPLSASIVYTPKGGGQNPTYEPLPGGQLAPGQMAVVFLAGVATADDGGAHVACPDGVEVGVLMDASVGTLRSLGAVLATGSRTGMGHAFRITASAPIAAYDIYPYGGAVSAVSSATLLIPTSAWGTNYIAVDAWYSDSEIWYGRGDGPFTQVVATENDTTVTILPVRAIVGGAGVAAAKAGQPATYALSRGDLLQFHQADELAGSPISSNKRIGVWGGAGLMFIPTGMRYADTAHQQLVPIKSLGAEYVAVRYRDRIGVHEKTPWTLVGAVDDTVLTYDPERPFHAPASLSSGQVVRFETTEPFVVRSTDDKHPFYLAGHMTSSQLPELVQPFDDPSERGDPEFVNAVPPQQWLRSYLFLTDPTYRTTNLVFVRRKTADLTFKDVMLDCAGTLTGWKAVDQAGQYEYAYVDLVKLGAPVGTCDNGAHTATSDAPFGLTVWGWDADVSYAYPAGMSIRPINTVVVPPDPK